MSDDARFDRLREILYDGVTEKSVYEQAKHDLEAIRRDLIDTRSRNTTLLRELDKIKETRGSHSDRYVCKCKVCRCGTKRQCTQKNCVCCGRRS